MGEYVSGEEVVALLRDPICVDCGYVFTAEDKAFDMERLVTGGIKWTIHCPNCKQSFSFEPTAFGQ